VAHAEASARTVEAAVAAAAAELGLRPDQVDIEILEEPVPSTFGFIGSPARVRVTTRTPSASSGPPSDESRAAGSPSPVGPTASGTSSAGASPAGSAGSAGSAARSSVGSAGTGAGPAAAPPAETGAAGTGIAGTGVTGGGPVDVAASALEAADREDVGRTTDSVGQPIPGSSAEATESGQPPSGDARPGAAPADGDVAAGAAGAAQASAFPPAVPEPSDGPVAEATPAGTPPDSGTGSEPDAAFSGTGTEPGDAISATGSAPGDAPSATGTAPGDAPSAASTATAPTAMSTADASSPPPPPPSETSRPARRDHRDEPLAPEMIEADTEHAGDFLEGLLDALDVDGDITTWVDEAGGHIDLEGADLDSLIGSNGETLDALQELTRLAVLRRSKRRVRLLLDINGFRAQHRAQLIASVRAMADQVVQTREDLELQPMTPAERKIVHDAVAALDGVTTESLGEEPNRRVVIRPA
jgi:spoIIIJ-associated protein